MILSIALAFIFQQDSITEPEFVTLFHELNNKQEEEFFINSYKDSSVDAIAYVIALEMKKAEYTISPWNKLKIFRTQKKRLNLLIDRNPKNIHLRYVRLVLQEQTPSFLGYNENITEDKNILELMMSQEDSTDYLDKYITQYTSL